jgi:hypothetical protein
MSFLGLLESQMRAEKTIINAMQTDEGYALMKALLAPHLNGFQPQNLDIIRKLKLKSDMAPDIQ